MQLYRQEASPDDVNMISRMLLQGIAKPESFEADTYLNELVPKPWGHEYRVYCDQMYDIWQLRIEGGRQTSLHCHLNKDTVLLCLSGAGQISFLNGKTQTIVPGSSVYIRRGAFHTTRAYDIASLDLVEVENPRNKFDLLRAQDAYGRVQTAYESNCQRRADLAPLTHIPGTRSLIRHRDLHCVYSYSYNLLSAADLLDEAVSFVVFTDVEQHLTGEIHVLGGHDPVVAAHVGRTALIIRRHTTKTNSIANS